MSIVTEPPHGLKGWVVAALSIGTDGIVLWFLLWLDAVRTPRPRPVIAMAGPASQHPCEDTVPYASDAVMFGRPKDNPRNSPE